MSFTYFYNNDPVSISAISANNKPGKLTFHKFFNNNFIYFDILSLLFLNSKPIKNKERSTKFVDNVDTCKVSRYVVSKAICCCHLIKFIPSVLPVVTSEQFSSRNVASVSSSLPTLQQLRRIKVCLPS